MRRFCLGAFALLHRESEREAPLSFAFEEHALPGRPTLYEYRPLVRSYVEARAEKLLRLDDARVAVEEIEREPGASTLARAHGAGVGAEPSLYRALLLPLLVRVAEGCGGFEWDDAVFDRLYAELEDSLFGRRHRYGAAAPLVGLSCPVAVELGLGLRVRMAAAGEPAALWPEARGLLPNGFGREPERACLLELERVVAAGEAVPDAPGELADAVSALRLATGAAVAAGPVVFERLDWRPYGVRPLLPIAATEPRGETSRLDEFRGRLARDLLERLPACDVDCGLGEALDRWELSLLAPEPLRSDLVREALQALLGGGEGAWAATARAAVLVGATPAERARVFARLKSLMGGDEATAEESDLLRRALVETLMYGDRSILLQGLDEALLGLAPRPASYLGVRAVAG